MHGMQTRRRLFPSLVTALSVLSISAALVTGCSSGSKPSGAPLPDASTLVKESTQTTKNATSVHMALSVTGKVKGLPLKSLTGDLTTVPTTAAKGDAQLTVAGSEIDAPFVIYDNNLYAALTPNKWSNWGLASDIYDPSTILKPDAGLANILTKMTDAKADGRDTIDGQATIRITGQAPADAVNQLMPPLRATQPLAATVWIQETGDHQLLQAQLAQSPGNFVQTVLSKWGAPVQVTKPSTS